MGRREREWQAFYFGENRAFLPTICHIVNTLIGKIIPFCEMKIFKNDPILIIGASLGGLCTALALKQQGFEDIKIFDKAKSLYEEDRVIHLGANALGALKQLQISERVLLAGNAWESYELRWKNNKVLHHLGVQGIREKVGFPPVSILQSELIKILTQQLGADILSLETEFISFTQNTKQAEAHFSSRDSIEGALIIGADGLQSRVRLQLKGQIPIREDLLRHYTAFIDEVELTEALRAPYLEVWDSALASTWAPLQGGNWGIGFAVAPATLKKSGLSLVEFLKAKTEKWDFVGHSLVQGLREQDLQLQASGDFPIKKEWAQGRVVLTGRAIHPILPYAQQDAAMELESAIVLANRLGAQNQLKKAFKQYEQARRKRTQKASRLARHRMKAFAGLNPMLWFKRYGLMGSRSLPMQAKAYQQLQSELIT